MLAWNIALFIYDKYNMLLYKGFCVDRIACSNPIRRKLKKIVKAFYGEDFFDIKVI